MILKRLILENYCLFAGRHEFDLTPRVKYGALRPIILFGGKNGAGKTTCLSAIQLAFYGRQSIGAKTTEKEYHLALRNRIHRNVESQLRASFAKVGLAFEIVTQGEKHEYYLERSWMAREDASFSEFLKVERDGKKLEEISSEHLQGFIADIVPERLSQLFFFDGEKIKNIAEDITSNSAISDAIQTLLGLDTVKALQTDLNVFRSRLLKSADPIAYEQEIASVESEILRITEERDRVLAEEMHARTLIDGIKADIARLERQLSQQGGSFAKARATNANLASELEAKLNVLEEQIREECDSALPFALCPNVSRRLAAELENESRSRRYNVVNEELSQLWDVFSKSAEKKFTASVRKEVMSFLESGLSSFRTQRFPGFRSIELHSISEREATLAIECLQNQSKESVKRLSSKLSELSDAEHELRLVNKDLEKSPEQLVLQDVFSELNLRNQDLGRALEVKRNISERLREVEAALGLKLREKERIEAKLAEADDVASKTALIQKLQQGVAAYMSRLTEAKIAQLQSEITECFNRLSRKSDFVRRVEINSSDFSVSVIDKFGRSVPKEDLSSGEKQIFAIAMLWGLARTSGRPLPIVVDTPLGRLDSDHRKNLVKNYFPHAGHQVILFSTDTEVDVSLFEELSPSVSHCYHLTYDQEQARTTASPEYFWREAAAR